MSEDTRFNAAATKRTCYLLKASLSVANATSFTSGKLFESQVESLSIGE